MKIANADICGVILSGGASARMGIPKALLEFGDGTTLLSRQDLLLSDSGCRGVLVVVGTDAGKIRVRHKGLEVEWVFNEKWELGQFSSIQAALPGLLRGTYRGAVVLPVDVVGVKTETVSALIEAFLLNPHLDAVVPEHEGKGGHPILISRSFAERLTKLNAAEKDSRLDTQIERSGNVIVLPVNDPAITRNVNTMEEWKKHVE